MHIISIYKDSPLRVDSSKIIFEKYFFFQKVIKVYLFQMQINFLFKHDSALTIIN